METRVDSDINPDLGLAGLAGFGCGVSADQVFRVDSVWRSWGGSSIKMSNVDTIIYIDYCLLKT
jgi:hypothetical protein